MVINCPRKAAGEVESSLLLYTDDLLRDEETKLLLFSFLSADDGIVFDEFSDVPIMTNERKRDV